jgi:hypothetical protein
VVCMGCHCKAWVHSDGTAQPRVGFMMEKRLLNPTCIADSNQLIVAPDRGLA